MKEELEALKVMDSVEHYNLTKEALFECVLYVLIFI